MSDNIARLNLDALEDALIALLQRPNVQQALAEALPGHLVTPTQMAAALSEERARASKGAVAYFADKARRDE